MNEFIIALVSAFFIIGVAELGDKTQILVVTFATKYKTKDILIGVTLAIIALNVMAVGLGSAITKLIPMNIVSVFAGISFILFAGASILSNKKEKVELQKSKATIPMFILIGFTFFLAELGDKTQIVTIAIAANNKGYEIAVLVGAVFAMILVDCLGLVLGKLLRDKISNSKIKWLSVTIFTVFGEFTLFSSLKNIIGVNSTVCVISLILLALIFTYFKKKAKHICEN